jgi:hypothetical protein
MSQDPLNQRKFTEKETGAILRRAAELQAEEEGVSSGDGASLAQLQQAAAELGIKPEIIAKAAADIAGGRISPTTSSFWGSPRKIEMERIVGYPITEESWPAILEQIRSVSGRVGDSRTIGKSLEWTSSSPETLHVTILPQGEHSRIKVASHVGEWRFFTYMLSGVAAIVASIGLTASHPGWSLPVDMAVVGGMFAAGFGAARTIYQALGAARRRTTEALLAALENPPEQIETEIRPAATYQTPIEQEAQPAQQVVGVVDHK